VPDAVPAPGGAGGGKVEENHPYSWNGSEWGMYKCPYFDYTRTFVLITLEFHQFAMR
jgi:hypothetical protein